MEDRGTPRLGQLSGNVSKHGSNRHPNEEKPFQIFEG